MPSHPFHSGGCLKQILPRLVFFLICGIALSCAHKKLDLDQGGDECMDFIAHFTLAVKKNGVADASTIPIEGFPCLRGDRFLASLKTDLTDDAKRRAWVACLHETARDSMRKEALNLPLDAVMELMAGADVPGDPRAWLVQRLDGCIRSQHEQAVRQPDFFHAVDRAFRAPDEYALWLRIAGVYPVTVLPVYALTRRGQNKFRKWHQTDREAFEERGGWEKFRAEGGEPFDSDAIRAIFDDGKRDEFGLALLTPTDKDMLARMFAPVVIQEGKGGEYDRFGAVTWEGDNLAISGGAPTIYVYLTNAFYNRTPIWQINYAIWYPAREAPAPWIERGPLDGLTLRISLDSHGMPFMAELMNNCGCYHFFVPDKKRIRNIRSDRLGLDPFVPVYLPEDFPARRLQIMVNSGWHQVVNVSVENGPADGATYTLTKYDALEALPRPGGGARSMFGPRGVARGSVRVEPLLLFSMGIHDVGSMRQRGHHAIKLVGRAHFDDPWLFDERFDFAY